jgi:uncharacterized protein
MQMNEIAVPAEWLEKEENLKKLISGYGSIAVAYSGGVDSTYLADVAHETLGVHAWMFIADTPSMPRAELRDAVDLATRRNWQYALIKTDEFAMEEFLSNESRRCYACKSELFGKMRECADANGISVIAYGETADDAADATRFGAIAAREMGIAAPLLLAGMKKEEIRALSKKRGLPTWNKASFACLSSRIPTGTRITPEILQRVERAEDVLKNLGFRQYRVRHHGNICRIEVEAKDFDALIRPQTREALVREMTDLGYRYVTLDLAGYRTGSTAG